VKSILLVIGWFLIAPGSVINNSGYATWKSHGMESTEKSGNHPKEKSLYVIEYSGIAGVKVRSVSEERPDLNRVFENGDKTWWYLTEAELKNISFSVDSDTQKEWYRVERTNLYNDRINLTLAPTYRYDRLRIITSENGVSIKIYSNDTKFYSLNDDELPEYPPSLEWHDMKEVGHGDMLLVLAGNELAQPVGSFDLTVEVPWGYESEAGQKSWAMSLETSPDEVKEIAFDLEKLPLIPLIFVDYSEATSVSQMREIYEVLKNSQGKAYIALGHDGRIVYAMPVHNSRPERWNRLKQYLNRFPTTGYASLPRNEIGRFVDQIKLIQYSFWGNHIAVPILIFSSQNHSALSEIELEHCAKEIEQLSKDRLIKDELVLVAIGARGVFSEKVKQVDKYKVYNFSWSTREFHLGFTKLLENLTKGQIL
jgi:hypothetical protein